jgi:type II secretory pathway component PulF
MAQCIYCGERSGLFAKVCGDCNKLLTKVGELRGKVGYGEFLDGLAETGVPK